MNRLPVVAAVVCTIFLFSLVLIPFTNADWTMFHADPSHSGLGTGNAVLTPVLLWKYIIGDFYSSPAVVAGVVYVGSENGNVYALNATSGAQLWNYTIGGQVRSSPAVVGGVVYVGSFSSGVNALYALNATSGAQLWNYTTGFYVESSPAVVGGVVYVGSNDTKVYALDATNGAQLWNYTTGPGGEVYSSPAVFNGTVYIGSLDNHVYALDATNGVQRWNYTTGNGVYSSPAVVNDVVYIGSMDDNVYALNAIFGTVLWSYLTSGQIESSPAVVGGVVYIGSSDGNVYALNSSSTLTASISPTSVTLDVGQSQLFTAIASGGSEFYTSYQWYVNEQLAQSGNSSIMPFTPSSSGSYSVTVTVTDSLGATSAQSTAAPVTVNSALIAPTVSASKSTFDQGQTSSLTSTAVSTGTPPYSYLWLVKAPGASSYSTVNFATLSSYSFFTSVFNATGVWSFKLQVTDSASTPVVVTSTAVSVTLNAASTVTPTPTPTPTATATPTPTSTLPSPSLSFDCVSSTTYSGFNVEIQGALTYNGVGLSGAGIQFSYSVTGGATWQDLAYVDTGDNGSFSVEWLPSASGNDVINATWSGNNVYSSVSTIVNFAVAPFDNQDQNVFSVTSNSTLSSLAFDSATDELSFSVSGPPGTTGYAQVCIPKSLLSDVSTLQVTLDGATINYNSLSVGDVWIITLSYHHSSHAIVMSLNAAKPTPSHSGSGSLGNQLVLIAIIAFLVAIIVLLIILNRRKRTQLRPLEKLA